MIRGKIVRLTILIALITAVPPQSFAQTVAEERPQPDENVLSDQQRAAHLADQALVVAWNTTINEIAFSEDQFQTFKGVRAHAMMHIAIHDALNAVIPLYEQFAYRRKDPFAHPIAAAAQAAHDVVASVYPGSAARLDQELANWLARVPDGPAKRRGITLGRKSANAVLALRESDGWDFQGKYVFSSGPGAYQTTPPWNGFVLQPGFRLAKPFGLPAAEQFRPAPPPALESSQYAEAFNEVKAMGSVNSTTRTLDQTRYAIWWMEFAEGSVNRLARQLVTHRKPSLWKAARMFALLNMSLFDGYLATWDSKYEHNRWRPYTSIREAASDRNPATEPDSNWEPLRPTPPFPEYVSAHSAACAASFEILRTTFGDQVSFTMETTTAPPEMPRRSFQSFSVAAAECADSRVRLGFHYRYSTNLGLRLGRSVAEFLEHNYLELRRRPAPDPR